MRRGTTPTVVLTVTNEDGSALDLTGADLHVTLQEQGSGGHELTKTGEDVSAAVDGKATVLTVSLTQAETLAFHEGRKVRAQLRAKTANGKAVASTIAAFDAEEILLEGEI